MFFRVQIPFFKVSKLFGKFESAETGVSTPKTEKMEERGEDGGGG